MIAWFPIVALLLAAPGRGAPAVSGEHGYVYAAGTHQLVMMVQADTSTLGPLSRVRTVFYYPSLVEAMSEGLTEVEATSEDTLFKDDVLERNELYDAQTLSRISLTRESDAEGMRGWRINDAGPQGPPASRLLSRSPVVMSMLPSLVQRHWAELASGQKLPLFFCWGASCSEVELVMSGQQVLMEARSWWQRLWRKPAVLTIDRVSGRWLAYQGPLVVERKSAGKFAPLWVTIEFRGR